MFIHNILIRGKGPMKSIGATTFPAGLSVLVRCIRPIQCIKGSLTLNYIPEFNRVFDAALESFRA